jgi:hypothetical protein
MSGSGTGLCRPPQPYQATSADRFDPVRPGLSMEDRAAPDGRGIRRVGPGAAGLLVPLIESNPKVMMGNPVVAGTLIPVESVLEAPRASSLDPYNGMRYNTTRDKIVR